MYSITICHINHEFNSHPIPIPTPSFLGCKEPAKFKHEEKCLKAIAGYNETIIKLQDELHKIEGEPSTKSAASLRDRVTQAKTSCNLLNSQSLILLEAKQALLYHYNALKQAEALACQILMGDVEVITLPEVNNELAETSYKEAKALEETIDLQKVFILAETNCREARDLFTEIIKKIFFAHTLYQKALNHGKNSATLDVQRTAIYHQLFRAFEDKFFDNVQFKYNFFALFPPSVEVPLTYNDWRLKPLIDFFIRCIDYDVILQEKNMKSLIAKYMQLSPDSKISMSILKMTFVIFSLEKFIHGGNDWEEGDLEEYRNEKVKLLWDIIEAVKEDCILPEVSKLPKVLTVNQAIIAHVRTKHLVYAHNNGIVIDEHIKDQVDQSMARLRADYLRTVAEDGDNNNAPQYAYLSRRDSKNLGLLLEPQKKFPYSPSDIEHRTLNMTLSFLKWRFEGITEPAMISHLLASANQKFVISLRSLMQKQGSDASSWDGYFSEEDPQKLSKEGARALLFATGYLIPKQALAKGFIK